MKNLEITAVVNAFMVQKQKGEGIKLPAAIAWKRRVNIDKLIQAKRLIDEAIQEIRQKYAGDEYSVEQDDGSGGKNRMVKPEFLAQFVSEQNEILTQDTEVEIRKVKIEDLGEIELSDADMDTISFMIED